MLPFLPFLLVLSFALLSGTMSTGEDAEADDQEPHGDGDSSLDIPDTSSLTDDETDDDSEEETDPPIDAQDGAEDEVDVPADAQDEDIGAVLGLTEDGAFVYVGEDETRDLALIYYADWEEEGLERDEARFYLVAEETDWSGETWENRYELPGIEEYTAELPQFEDNNGLELIGVIDLNDVIYDLEDPEARIGTLDSNVPFESYFLEAATDGDALLTFVRTEDNEYTYVMPDYHMVEDTTGTNGDDYFFAIVEGITLDGAGGDDGLVAGIDNVTLIGGDGNDGLSVRAGADGAFAFGGEGNDTGSAYAEATIDLGAGDDRFTMWGGGLVLGGDGNDTLQASNGNAFSDDPEPIPAYLFGQSGEDTLRAYHEKAVAYGGSGDDTLTATNGGAIFGDDGDDYLTVGSGSTGHGGAGDDAIVLAEFHTSALYGGSSTVTGGDGSDTFNISMVDRAASETPEFFVRITDFDPEEDVLTIDAWDLQYPLESFEIVEADDGSYTDIQIYLEATDGSETAVNIIRIDGTPGITADHIVGL